MAVNTKAGVIVEIDKLIDSIEHNQETTGLLSGLFAIVQQVDRSFQRETKFAAKKKTPGATATGKAMPPSAEFTKEDFEKKTRIREVAKPVDDVEVPDLPPPTEVETRPQTNEAELLDIVTDGLDKAKENFKKPGDFKKKLKSIGVDATGKTIEELFGQAQEAFDKISQ